MSLLEMHLSAIEVLQFGPRVPTGKRHANGSVNAAPSEIAMQARAQDLSKTFAH